LEKFERRAGDIESNTTTPVAIRVTAQETHKT
jgi:hypothetical protein